MRARTRALAAVITALSLTAPGAALAQTAASAKPAATGAAAAATPDAKATQPDAKAAKPDAKAAKAEAPQGAATQADAGAPSASASAAPAGSGALPPGDPSVGSELPAGHPSTGGNPHGGAMGRDGLGMFEAPEDTVQEDTSLPPGVIEITVQDADGNPVPGAPIDLEILRSSVSRGDSRERVSQQAGADGSFRFGNLPVGAGTSFGFSVTRQGATFSMPAFGLGAEAGKRAVLHVYDASSDVSNLLVGMQGILYIQLRQDSIAVEQLFQMFNLGRVAWVPSDVTFALPEGYKAFNKPDAEDDMRFDEVKGTGVALRGTVSPGRHEANYRFQVPLAELERQTLRIELPPRMAQMRVMAEASKAMTLEVAGFPQAQRTQNRDGKKILITEKQASRADGGLRVIEITLGGLPTPGTGRWVALALAGATVLGALGYAFSRREDREIDDDARRELLEARNALLDEIVELERARTRGDVGPKTYARVRTALLDALARIVDMLEAAAAPAKAGGPSAGSSKRDKAAASRT